MAWQTPTALGTSSPISSTTYGDLPGAAANGISLNPGGSCVIQIGGTAAAVTSDLQFQVLTSPDGGTTWDTLPWTSGSVAWPLSAIAARRSISVYGCKTFKIQFSVSAAQTWTGVNATYVLDGISA